MKQVLPVLPLAGSLPLRQSLAIQKVLVVIEYVCIKTYLYDITRDFSSSLAIEMYGQPFLFRPIST